MPQVKMDLDAMMMRQHIEIVHQGDDGYIALCSINQSGSFSQRHYLLDELLLELDCMKVDKDKNYYFSVNSFYRPERLLENVRQIRALYADIDCHTLSGAKAQRAIADTIAYLDVISGDKLPTPSIVVKTGRGLQLYWIIEDLPKQGVPLWKMVQDAMTDRLMELVKPLKGVTVDNVSDISRILRLSGTINTKAQRMAKLQIKHSNKHRLDNIIENYFPDLAVLSGSKPAKKKPTSKHKEKPTIDYGRTRYLYNLYSLHYARLCDLSKLLELRKGVINADECRRRMVFLYRYWSCCYLNDTQRALQETLAFNARFSEPLSKSIVKSATQSAEKAYFEWQSGDTVTIDGKQKRKGYNYRNKTLVEMLDITDEEQLHMQTIIGTEEKYRRNNERRRKTRYGRDESGLTAAQRKRKRMAAQAKVLADKGRTQREIAAQLGCSQKTVSNYLSSF